MDLWVVILVGVLALLAGVALGFFIARKYMMNYLKKIRQLMNKCCA